MKFFGFYKYSIKVGQFLCSIIKCSRKNVKCLKKHGFKGIQPKSLNFCETNIGIFGKMVDMCEKVLVFVKVDQFYERSLVFKQN